jgi:hypothetical protein
MTLPLVSLGISLMFNLLLICVDIYKYPVQLSLFEIHYKPNRGKQSLGGVELILQLISEKQIVNFKLD